MDRNTKREIVSKLREDLSGIKSVFICDFNGLTVAKDTQLRRKMRETGAEYAVIKNTLLKLAFVDSEFSQVGDKLTGNTALAYHREDVVALAKLIKDFAKENEAFKFKAGVVEGKVLELSQLEQLANMPSKEVLISKLMYMLNYPVQGMVTALSGITRKLVVALDQIKQQKENNGVKE
jgi:large subunit ribosomal protein L10